MGWWHFSLLGIVSFLYGTNGTFAPNVTVLSCSSQRVVVQLENAAENGLIYIQGRGLSCSRTTVAYKKSYEFDFELCHIEYDTKFRVVVQKKSMYQTGYDKVIPVMCIVDTSDLFVSGFVFPAETLDASALNKTIRPTVSMRIMTGQDGESIEEVTINDQVTLSLKLDDPYIEDFDIKAKDCRAEMISLVDKECSQDEELFPNFERQSKGDITSAFQAFQPTNLDGQSEVDVAFTCNVAVCKGECRSKICGEIVGWGRRRRDNEEDEDDDVYEKVTVATKLKVKSPEQDVVDDMTSALTGRLCMEKVAIAIIMAITALTLVVSWIVCAFVTSKLRNFTKMSSHGQNKPSAMRRMSEKNINFARSVGRRLSTMLNLPIGYNMREPKMMDDYIPEVEPSPHTNRRESVTVSTETDDTPYVREQVMYATTKKAGLNIRRRFVDSSVQTDSDSCIVVQDQNSQHPMNPKTNPVPFLTSISIKSGLSKSKSESESVKFPSKTYKNSPANGKSPELQKSDSIGSMNDGSVIQYSVDEIPKVRSPHLPITNKGTTVVTDPYLKMLSQYGSPKPMNADDDHSDYEVISNVNITDVQPISNEVVENYLQRGDTLVEQNIPERSSNVEQDYEPIDIVNNVKRERKHSTHV